MSAADQIRQSTDPEWMRRQIQLEEQFTRPPSGRVSPSDEKAAREWLDAFCRDPENENARTLKAMLQRPVMPEEPSDESAKVIRDTWASFHGDSFQIGRAIYRAIYAHLAKPQAPKTVWYVTSVKKGKDGVEASSTAGPFDGPDDASREAQNLLRADFRRVVTISPHVAEVSQ